MERMSRLAPLTARELVNESEVRRRRCKLDPRLLKALWFQPLKVKHDETAYKLLVSMFKLHLYGEGHQRRDTREHRLQQTILLEDDIARMSKRLAPRPPRHPKPPAPASPGAAAVATAASSKSSTPDPATIDFSYSLCGQRQVRALSSAMLARGGVTKLVRRCCLQRAQLLCF